MQKPGIKGHLGTMAKLTTGIVSVATAGVTIFTFARSYGLVGAPAPAALTVGNLGVNWIGLSPPADTAFALGDTVRFAATVTDQNGTALFGATIHWTSDDSTVAQPIGAGRVVARHPGTAMIIAIAGQQVARSKVVVRQRVASVHFDRDTMLTVAEDESRRLVFRALDARGNMIPARRGTWTASDTAVVSVDSLGTAQSHAEGRAEISVDVDGVSTRIPVAVVPMPGTVEVRSGATQRALAGATLPQPVAVRVLSKHGRPMTGIEVRFHTSDGLGKTDPSTAKTDSHGLARTSWTLASLPGRQHLIASAEGLDSTAGVIAEADPTASNTHIVALVDSLHGTPGQTLADTIGIRATDKLGRALGDVPVTWIAEDHGQVTGLAERTDSLGEAHAIWTLGSAPGVQHVRARLGSGRTVPAFVMRAQVARPPERTVAITQQGAPSSHHAKTSPKKTSTRSHGSK